GGEKLTELHERRPELVEHLAQAPAAIAGRLAVDRATPIEEVAEPVPRRDAPDLRGAGQALLRLGGHVGASPRRRPSRAASRGARAGRPGARGPRAPRGARRRLSRASARSPRR